MISMLIEEYGWDHDVKLDDFDVKGNFNVKLSHFDVIVNILYKNL